MFFFSLGPSNSARLTEDSPTQIISPLVLQSDDPLPHVESAGNSENAVITQGM